MDLNKRIALSMNQYGVKLIVLTTLANLESAKNDFESSSDSEFFNGKGKQALHAYLLKTLRSEDQFFDRNLKLATPESQRWRDLMEDCVIFAALDALLFGRPIHLIHPSEYQELIKKGRCDATSGEMPDLIAEIPIMSEKQSRLSAMPN